MDVDQRFATLTLGQRFIEKCADLLVEAFLRHWIICLRVFWNLTRHRAAFRFPFVATAIEDFHFLMTKQSERPECVTSPPVRLVAVENASGVRGNAMPAAKTRKFLR